MNECSIKQSKVCPHVTISGELCSACTIPDLTGTQCLINLRIVCPEHKAKIRDVKMCKLCQIPYDLEKALLANQGEFKIKFNGSKLTVVELKPTEIIDDRCLYQIVSGEQHTDERWYRSNAIGDQVLEHPIRRYVRVLSPWWK